MGYFYLYDSYLQDRAYANLLIKLETMLTDLGLQGRVGRLTLLKSVRDLVENALRDGADTVVAVGNDITLSQVATALARHTKVVLGFVPLGSKNQAMAKILGIPQGLTACHVLSGRITQPVTLGKVNNQYFMQSVVTHGAPTVECEGLYRLNVSVPHELRVANLDLWGDEEQPPRAGLLGVVLTPHGGRGWDMFGTSGTNHSSVVPIQNLTLTSQGDELPLVVDGYRTVKTPASISATAVRLKVIVGKQRLVE